MDTTGTLPWGAMALGVLALLGMGLAGYLTAVHYAPALLVCSDQGLVNCEAVLTSSYSVLPGTAIPITVPGLAFFLISLVLALAQLRRPEVYGLRQVHAVWGGLGLLTALYLVFIEVVEVHYICLWCSTVHVTLLVTFLITLWRAVPQAKSPPPRRSR
ncbi:MAG: vitamin K epoxide reductase family protein [Candidatus Dormibacteria bacterium]